MSVFLPQRLRRCCGGFRMRGKSLETLALASVNPVLTTPA
jgi:hypothetical protein